MCLSLLSVGWSLLRLLIRPLSPRCCWIELPRWRSSVTSGLGQPHPSSPGSSHCHGHLHRWLLYCLTGPLELEFAGTGDFVRLNELQEGDFIVIPSDIKSGKYVMFILLFPLPICLFFLHALN